MDKSKKYFGFKKGIKLVNFLSRHMLTLEAGEIF